MLTTRALCHTLRCVALLAPLSLHAAAFAQAVPPRKADPAPVTLSQDPFEIEALGLAIYLPEGAATSTTMMNAQSSALIFDNRGTTPTWQIVVSARSTARTDLTVQTLVDDAARQLLEANAELQRDKTVPTNEGLVKPGQSRARVIDRQPPEGQSMFFRSTKGDELPAARVYVEIPEVRGNQPVVRGITAVQVSPQQFVLFELMTTADVYAGFRQTYETCVASTQFRGVAEAGVQRAEMISAGSRLMAGVGEDELVSLAEKTEERWERLYRPSPDGKQANDEEVGYRRITITYGKPSGRRGGGSDRGVIVEIKARVIEKNQLIDSESWFFMTPDRERENWEVTMAVRDLNSTGKNDRPPVMREVGARMGDQMNVRIETGGPATNVKPDVLGEGYVSRAEAYLLPTLLLDRRIAGRFGFYSYNTNAGKITFRRDVLERSDNDTWTLTTRLAEGQPEQVMRYRADGTLLDGTLQNGVKVEETTGQSLLDLWKKKGLPI